MADRRDGLRIASAVGLATVEGLESVACQEEEWVEAAEWGCVGAEVQVEVHDADGAGCEGAVVVA